MPYFRGRYVTEEEHTRLEQDYLNRVKMELDRLEYDRIKANWDQLDEQQRLEELEQKYDDDLNLKEDLSAEENQNLDQTDEQLRQHQEDAERVQEGAQREQEARETQAREEDETRLEQARETQEQETEQIEASGEAQDMDRTSFDAMADEADQREAAAAGLQKQAEESEELDLTPDESLMDEERQRGARL